MKLLKPSWVHHEGKPIFSIDIHPDGSRFATGGQGENSGIIIIWNLAPVRDETVEKDEHVPKMLCQMDNHLGCVNCVRWSNNGRLLASGGDDKLVMIWQVSRYRGASTVFGSDGQFTNIEQWRVANVLRGHAEDVLDLAWSPHDAWLASCSVDNTIIVWNANKFPEQLALLRGHTGLVKGVTWDPVGKYLASQSDDKTLRVWRTSDWAQEACVEKPFIECGGTTHVLRLNWSPDGHYIVSAHAMNNCGPTAQIVERDGWKATLDFVGHRKAITCVRFNQNVLRKRMKKNSEKSQQYTCCAIGSRDRSVSVWLTALKRPLVVTHDLFKNSVLDLSWNVNGLELMCCSADGTVAYLSFNNEEIGKPITKDEKIELHKKIFGKSLLSNNCDVTASEMIIESSALLKLQQQKAEEGKKRPPSRDTTPLRTTENSNLQTPTKQIETRTKDGKRRITPIFLSFQPDIGEAPLPFSMPSQPMFSSSKEQSIIVREKLNSVSEEHNLSQNDDIKHITTPPNNTSQQQVSSTKPQSQSTKQTQPVGGTVISPVPGSAGMGKPNSSSTPNTQQLSPSAVLQSSTDKMQKALDASHKLPGSAPSHKPSVKRKLDHSPSGAPSRKSAGGSSTRGRPRKLAGHSMPVKAGIMPHREALPQAPVQPAVVQTRIVYTNSGLGLQVPDLQRNHTVQVDDDSSSDPLCVEVENNALGAGTIHKITVVRGVDGMVWQNLITSPVLALAANGQVCCVAGKDQSISIFSTPSGRKIMPRIMLDSHVHQLLVSAHFCMAVTARGQLYVWNARTCEVVIKGESLIAVIPDDTVHIEKCILTDQGLPILTLSTGVTYTYKLQLGAWIIVHNKSDTLHMNSDHFSCVPRPEAQVQGTLAHVQNSKNRAGSSASRLYKLPSSLQQSSTLSYLENQVTTALALQSDAEYHFWFITHVRYLVQEGLENRLREICDDLIGPVIKSKSSRWQPSILGLKKRALLEESLPLIGSNLHFQRLYAEYQEQLASTGNS